MIKPLRYNTAQQDVWSKVADRIDRLQPIRLIILKSRREGISTAIESWLLTFIASMPNVNALITAHQKDAAKEIFAMSKLFVTSSPLLARVATVDRDTITIGRSRLKVATAGSPESQRGVDLTAWHSSEAAQYDHPEVMLATMQCLPQRDDVFSIGVIESTANGKTGSGEMFYDEWCRAEAGESDWLPIFLPWHEFTDYRIKGAKIEQPTAEEFALRERFELTDEQLAWRRWAVRNKCHGDEDLANQEYPPTADRAFVATGRPFFRPEQMLPFGKYVRKGHLGVVTPDGEWSQQTKGWLEVFQYPKPGHTYLIGADSSMGLEEDDRGKSPSSSAAEVLDMETLEQVAEYDFRSPPHIFAAHLAGIGRFYNTALQVPEVQSSGGGGGRELLVYLRETYGYWNIHHWKHPDRVNRQDSQLLGWETTSKTRPRMLARMREVVLEQSAIIHSKRLLAQLENFGYSDAGRTEALSGHDDLLFAWGIALVSRFENYYVMPPVASGPVEKVDWEHLGIHVTHPENPQERLRRILSTEASPTRSFMEL